MISQTPKFGYITSKKRKVLLTRSISWAGGRIHIWVVGRGSCGVSSRIAWRGKKEELCFGYWEDKEKTHREKEPDNLQELKAASLLQRVIQSKEQ